MKTLFSFSVVFFCSIQCFGQNINIPDPILKDFLLNRSAAAADTESSFDINVDTNGDGEIQVSEAEAVVALKIRNQDFVNPEGLQFFTNLEMLDISGNEIEAMELTSFTKLKILEVGGNNLAQVDLSNLLNLTFLNIGGNELVDINLSTNTLLEEIYIAGNEFTSLSISNLPNLIVLDPLPSLELKNLTISNNEKLTEIRLNLSFGQFHEFDNLVITNNASLQAIATDQLNATSFDCSNNPLSSLNLLPLTNMKDFRCSGELTKFQGVGLIFPFGVRNVNVEGNTISSLLFQDWFIDSYNFDTEGDVQIQIGSAGYETLQIQNSPSVTSITEIGDIEIPFENLDLENLPNLETLVLQRQNFSSVELIDFPKLSELKIGAEDIYLENVGIASYATDDTNGDVRLFATDKLTITSCASLLNLKFEEESLSELNILDIPSGADFEIFDGTYELVNIASSNFNDALIINRSNSDLKINTLTIEELNCDFIDIVINEKLNNLTIKECETSKILINLLEPCSLIIEDCPATQSLTIDGPFDVFQVLDMPELIEYECWFRSNPSLLGFHDFPKLESLILNNSNAFDIETKVEYSGLPLLKNFRCRFNRVNEIDDHLINFEDEYKLEDIFLSGQNSNDFEISKNHIRFCNMPSLKNFNHSYLNDTLNLDLSSCPKIEAYIIPRLCDTLNVSNGSSTGTAYGSSLSMNVLCVDDEEELEYLQQGSLSFEDYEILFDCQRACMITSKTSNEIADNQLQISPNPMSDFLMLSSSHAFTEISIRDINGQLISNQKLAQAISNFELKHLDLSNGVFFISIMVNDRPITKKLVVAK